MAVETVYLKPFFCEFIRSIPLNKDLTWIVIYW